MPAAGARKGAGKTTTDESQHEEKQLQLFAAACTAVQEADAKELSTLLRKHPQLPKSTDEFGRTLLHVAASHGQAESCDILLEESGCSPSELLAAKESESKWTPLHCALYKHNLRAAIQLLLSAGAGGVALLNGPGSEDKEGFTPLDLLSIVHRFARGDDAGSTSGGDKRPQRGGDVHCCGSGANYQLGSGANSDVKIPRRLAALRGYTIVQVATSSRHSLFLTDHGDIFAAGYGRGGRLGTGHEHTQPSPVPVAKLRHVTHVAAGPSGSAAISGDGNLFCWGLSGIGISLSDGGRKAEAAVLAPARVQSMREHRVKQVCLSERHLTVLTDKGALYTGGYHNAFGQLCSETLATSSSSGGGSDGQPPPSSPPGGGAAGASVTSASDGSMLKLRRVSALADQRIRMIACASYGGLALLEADVDYCFEWGWGSGTPRKVGLAAAAALQPGDDDRHHKAKKQQQSPDGGGADASTAGPRHASKSRKKNPNSAAEGGLRRFQSFHRAHKLSLRSVSVGAAACVLSASGEVYSWIPGAAPRGEAFTCVYN